MNTAKLAETGIMALIIVPILLLVNAIAGAIAGSNVFSISPAGISNPVLIFNLLLIVLVFSVPVYLPPARREWCAKRPAGEKGNLTVLSGRPCRPGTTEHFFSGYSTTSSTHRMTTFTVLSLRVTVPVVSTATSFTGLTKKETT